LGNDVILQFLLKLRLSFVLEIRTQQRIDVRCLYTEKNGFVTATKSGKTNKTFVAATKNFAAATKRFVVVTKYFCYPYYKK